MIAKELKILSMTKTEVGKRKLPPQFGEEIRPDIIERAVFVIRNSRRQPYGAKPRAGMRQSAEISRRRRDYKCSYGHGISRVPRKILSRRGTQFNWVGAVAPGTVGGRRAHPPKAEKIWLRKINKKERKKAIRSALAATAVPQIVSQRGHKIPNNYPFIIDDKFENLAKTRDIISALETIGFKEELERCAVKKIRAGKGKMRARKHKKRKGLLFVVSSDCALKNAVKNIPGVDIVEVSKLNAELLAPGCRIGRAVLFTASSIDKMEKDKLFM